MIVGFKLIILKAMIAVPNNQNADTEGRHQINFFRLKPLYCQALWRSCIWLASRVLIECTHHMSRRKIPVMQGDVMHAMTNSTFSLLFCVAFHQGIKPRADIANIA